MTDWKTIDSAPRDGTEVMAGRGRDWHGQTVVTWPVRSRFVDGVWCAKFHAGWRRYDPQPTHWRTAHDHA